MEKDNELTLRDYFAARAMAAFITEPIEGATEPMFIDPISVAAFEMLAKSSYVMADAMLKARNK